MAEREKESHDHLYLAVWYAIEATVGIVRHDPPWDTSRKSGLPLIHAALPLMVERAIISQGSADELLKYWSDREAVTRGNAVLTKAETDFLSGWAGRLEALFWSLVPLDRLPEGMLYNEVDPVTGMRTLQRRSRLSLDSRGE